MTYKETLLFIGQCLSINYNVKNKVLIEKKLQSNLIDWDNVVKVSTAHYVLPTLYCNFRRSNLLDYLPKDLEEYMKYITDLNRDRNKLIIEQAEELNKLLLENGVTPIFLKGTGNLIQGLYHDLGERMIGDIDIIISKMHFKKSILILKEYGYKTTRDNVWKSHRHYPEMIIDGRIGAVEIHKEFLRQEHIKRFNYYHISKNIKNVKNFNFLGYNDQFLLTIFSNQINDFGYQKKNVNLRTIYDTLLLSNKFNIRELNITDNYLNKIVTNFTISSEMILNYNFNLNTNFKYSKISKKFVKKFERNLELKKNFNFFKNKYLLLIYNKKNTIKDFLFNKEYRSYILRNLYKKSIN